MKRKDSSVQLRITEPLFFDFMILVDEWYMSQGSELIITSGSELSAKHSRTSLHYAGRAFDSRFWPIKFDDFAYFTSQDQFEMMCEIRDDYLDSINLPRDTIDIVLESHHIHSEWQPKYQS